MFLEVEDETRDFVTIYKKDFPSKEAERRKQYRPRATYPLPLNVLNGPYKKCLNTRRKNVTLPPEERSEDPDETLNRIRCEFPRLRNSFPEVAPDEDVVERRDKELTQTVYQLDYSKGDYSARAKIYGRGEDLRLPEDWIVSETVQTKSYRNPWKIATGNLLGIKRAKKPPDNLIPSEKEREVLRTRTGDSEYNATIDATGDQIIKESLVGTPLPAQPKIYSRGTDSPLSECSQILSQKKLVLPSNIF